MTIGPETKGANSEGEASKPKPKTEQEIKAERDAAVQTFFEKVNKDRAELGLGPITGVD
ncbi:MAG TPA: hypothetical protein VI795_03385 [Patescibacteria group bacterium]|nr:hypothetical protein [Patescibacteria group bacterium]